MTVFINNLISWHFHLYFPTHELNTYLSIYNYKTQCKDEMHICLSFSGEV